tara:strand:- start:248 stop:565 length:318 start_codon:yes stop_codon:yes gene_type:complete
MFAVASLSVIVSSVTAPAARIIVDIGIWRESTTAAHEECILGSEIGKHIAVIEGGFIFGLLDSFDVPVGIEDIYAAKAVVIHHIHDIRTACFEAVMNHRNFRRKF